MNDICVLYIAWRPVFVQKATASAKSFKRFHPDIDAVIVTNHDVIPKIFDNTYPIQIRGERHIIKTFNIRKFAEDSHNYKNILYLDSDTLVCGKLDGLFELMNKFDIALARAPVRRLYPNQRNIELPDAFSDLNSGVMLFRNTPMVLKILKSWYLRAKNYDADQPALCELLYEHARVVSIYVLPPEYNARVGFPGFFQGAVKIVHDGSVNLHNASREINTNKGMRVWWKGRTRR